MAAQVLGHGFDMDMTRGQVEVDSGKRGASTPPTTGIMPREQGSHSPSVSKRPCDLTSCALRNPLNHDDVTDCRAAITLVIDQLQAFLKLVLACWISELLTPCACTVLHL
ncbi:uncharacterized protein N7482_002316 [Penicillium canariense]|uniref:Uncharacterized protein n=1 Tax=Penicillium canariense TaxID=189055 RepID=A0A9W9IF32_9EURO|nr:uncharacterized protein N7482_002316 [Penicillium canariense]KAJ5176439.1 hypothetical protein N7482_002316 [Penicillium canariense]